MLNLPHPGGPALLVALFTPLIGCAPQPALTGSPELGERDRQAVVRLFTDVLDRGRAELLPELIAPQFVNVNTGTRGPEGMADGARFLRATFGDARFTVDDVFAAGDRVIVRWHLEGRHVGPYRGTPPTGEPVVMSAIGIYRMVDHKIAESWLETSAPRSPGKQ